jgi:hypothetical protein
MVIDEKQSEDEVTSTTDTNVMPTDESKTEAPSAKMVKHSLNINYFLCFFLYY